MVGAQAQRKIEGEVGMEVGRNKQRCQQPEILARTGSLPGVSHNLENLCAGVCRGSMGDEVICRAGGGGKMQVGAARGERERERGWKGWKRAKKRRISQATGCGQLQSMDICEEEEVVVVFFVVAGRNKAENKCARDADTRANKKE